MKRHIFFALFFLCSLFYINAQTPTFAEPPGPENVLVVYNPLDQTSIDVKNYYISNNGRNIPTINVVPLDGLEVSSTIFDPESNTTHTIELTQQGEIIKDINNSTIATRHAWIYFNERIAVPIANWLNTHNVNGTPLKDIIRFIVLCKGVPFRIDSRQEDADSRGTNVICANLLTRLGETMQNEDALLDYYNRNEQITNPYFQADKNYLMEHHFLPEHYQTSIIFNGYPRTISLSYLVTHLSAPRLSDVQGMIDRSKKAKYTSNYKWFIDGDPNPCMGWSPVGSTASTLQSLGINNYFFDNTTENYYTTYPDSVMSYSSNGTWTSTGGIDHECEGMIFSGNYIQNLNFKYSDGAFFTTIESHNGLSIGTYPVVRTRGQGLIADFSLMGGTVAVGQAFHSPGSHVISNQEFMPRYAMGYTFIESAYQGMQYLNATNVIVGDPLTIVYDNTPQTLPNGYVFSPGNYYGHYYVPSGNTVYFTSGMTPAINFRNNASIKIDGTIVIQQNPVISFFGYSKLELKNTSWYSNFIFNDNSSLVLDGNIILNTDQLLTMAANSNLYFKKDLNLSFGSNAKIQLLTTSKLYTDELNINSGETFVFDNLSSLNTYNLNVYSGSLLDFKSLSKCFVYEKIDIASNAQVNFAQLTTKDLVLQAGSNVTFIPGSSNINRSLSAIGEVNNRININLSPTSGILFYPSSFTLKYCNINGGFLRIFGDRNEDVDISISNSNFFNVMDYLVIRKYRAAKMIANLTNNSFQNCALNALETQEIDSLFIYQNTFNHINNSAIISTYNNYLLVDNCQFNTAGGGLKIDTRGVEADNQISDNTKVEIKNSRFETVDIGIDALFTHLKTLYINNNIFSANDIGIIGSQFNNSQIDFVIKQNQITNYLDYGIKLSSGIEAVIAYNNLLTTNNNSTTDQLIGIFIEQVANPNVINNTISGSGLQNPGPGIFLSSSNGQIRKNHINGHLHGIELGGSSPDIAENTIRGNKNYGIYASAYSFPNLSEAVIENETYPFGGYNEIYENGNCNSFNESSSEIYLYRSSINLQSGCNTIADDRYQPALNCDHRLLINGEGLTEGIKAQKNYWGNHPIYGNDPSLRFGDEIEIDFEGYYSEPCEDPEGGSFLLMANSSGSYVDSVYSYGGVVETLTPIDTRLAATDQLFRNKSYNQALTEYKNIIGDYPSNTSTNIAFNRLYLINNLINNNGTSSFAELKNYFQSKMASFEDSTFVGNVKHLQDLCLVQSGEYLSAIQNFDSQVQNNPNSDIAFYRELDALTVASLLDSSNSLGKLSTKYNILEKSDYNTRVKNLFNKRRGSYVEETTVDIPLTYNLYNNYPNPFNPVTTIKFDLPNDGIINLEIFDILGRRISTLVEEYRTAGSYEQLFNASALASGVYVYKLQAGDFVSSKKMILLK